MLTSFSCGRLCATLWTVAHQASLSMGYSRQEYWSGLLCPPPENLPDTGTEPVSPMSNLYWQAGSLPLAPPGKPLCKTNKGGFCVVSVYVCVCVCVYSCVHVYLLKKLWKDNNNIYIYIYIYI